MKSIQLGLMLLLLLAAGCDCPDGWWGPGCDQCVVRVSGSDGSDMNPGGSWDSAVATLQVGLDIAQARMNADSLGTCDVWVEEGTYRPSTTDSGVSFQLHPGIGLYGGFVGNEVDRDQRDWVGANTVLSGDLLGDDIPGDLVTNRADNSTLIAQGEEAVSIDGFEISGGGRGVASGGPLQSLSVANCRFIDNSSGAISHAQESTLTVDSCEFEGNGGNCIDAFSSGTTVVNDSTFTGNVNGIRSANSSGVTLTGSAFTDNTGTALSLNISYADVSRSSFEGNLAGAIDGHDCSLIVTNSSFRSNQAATGGAINGIMCSTRIFGSLFWNNSATVEGGALRSSTVGATITNSTFYQNAAPTGRDGSSPTSPLNFRNCILWGNGTESIAGQATFASSIVQGGAPGSGNLDSDPLFVAPIAGDLHVQESSPAIDNGDPGLLPDYALSIDLDGSPREVGVLDIGAYEFQSP